MRILSVVIAGALAVIGTQANAQTLSTGSQSSVTANTVIVPPGNGTAAGGGIGNATWIMGQTTGGNAITSYDACLKNVGITVLFAGIGIPLEIAHCWALRDMDAMAKFPPGSLQYEHGCRDSAWLQTDWDSGIIACTVNKAKLAKTNPNDPRAQPKMAVAVVTPGINTMANPGVNTTPPPTVAPTPGTNAPTSAGTRLTSAVDYGNLRRCTGPNDQGPCR